MTREEKIQALMRAVRAVCSDPGFDDVESGFGELLDDMNAAYLALKKDTEEKDG